MSVVIHTLSHDAPTCKVLVASKYSGMQIQVNEDVRNEDPEFVSRFPFGSMPVMETPEGPLCQSNAMAWYASGGKPSLVGTNRYETAQIQQYTSLADSEFVPISVLAAKFENAGFEEGVRTSSELRRLFKVLDKILETRTFLVGDRITLADIAVFFAIHGLYQRVTDSESRKAYVNLTRWHQTCLHQKEFESVIFRGGTDQIQDHDTPVSLSSTFNLETWKRYYSNEPLPASYDYFWQHYDRNRCSMYRVVYRYNPELRQTFMSGNLIGGFFNRLDHLRKHGFGSMCVFGEDNANAISGMFIFQTPNIEELLRDIPDYDVYSFEKVDPDIPEVRVEWEGYLAHAGEYMGKQFACGKIFK